MKLDIFCDIEPHEWKKFTKKLNDIGKYVEHRGYDFKYSLKNIVAELLMRNKFLTFLLKN